MNRRQIALLMLTAGVAALLSATVAYRVGLRRSFSFASARRAGPGCADFRDASSRVGEITCVSGRVLRAFTSRGGTSFLDFCADYRNCPFSAVIFASDRARFGDLEALAGRQVEVEGLVTAYQGRAEIIIRGPQQIRVLP